MKHHYSNIFSERQVTIILSDTSAFDDKISNILVLAYLLSSSNMLVWAFSSNNWPQ